MLFIQLPRLIPGKNEFHRRSVFWVYRVAASQSPVSDHSVEGDPGGEKWMEVLVGTAELAEPELVVIADIAVGDVVVAKQQ